MYHVNYRSSRERHVQGTSERMERQW